MSSWTTVDVEFTGGEHISINSLHDAITLSGRDVRDRLRRGRGAFDQAFVISSPTLKNGVVLKCFLGDLLEL